MMILCDIGGTHARFALYDGDAVNAIQKYSSNEFETFLEALLLFTKSAGIETPVPLYIAMAGAPSAAGEWRCTNKKAWIVSSELLNQSGWGDHHIFNDFEAAAWGIKDLTSADLETLQQGTESVEPYCLIGPGTGLGLAYLSQTPSPSVQKTHGGQMLATPVNEAQSALLEKMSDTFGRPIVFEDLASGRGLVQIYNAIGPATIETAADIVAQNGGDQARETLEHFHAFFGLFAQTAVLTCNAHGGLYMTGGVLENLRAQNLFDEKVFLEYFILSGAPSATQDALEGTPIHIVKDPYLAFRGLKYLIENAHA